MLLAEMNLQAITQSPYFWPAVAAFALFVAWRRGWFDSITAPKPAPAPAPVAQYVAPAPQAVAAPDATTLGRQFEAVCRRDAEYLIADECTKARIEEAVNVYKAPFSPAPAQPAK